MRGFFSVWQSNNDQFLIFAPPHIVVLVSLGLIILCMKIWRERLRPHSNFYRWVIAALSFTLECSYLVWLVRAGKWHFQTSLPLELCEVTFILCIVMLLGRSRRLFETAYYWGFIGSTLALLFPNLHVSFRHFTFWAFILTHSLNLISLAFMISVEGYRPTRKSIGINFITTNLYMLLIAALNHFLGSNYFYYYIFRKPAPNIANPLVYLNNWLYRILILEVVVIGAILICYLPVLLIKKTDYFTRLTST